MTINTEKNREFSLIVKAFNSFRVSGNSYMKKLINRRFNQAINTFTNLSAIVNKLGNGEHHFQNFEDFMEKIGNELVTIDEAFSIEAKILKSKLLKSEDGIYFPENKKVNRRIRQAIRKAGYSCDIDYKNKSYYKRNAVQTNRGEAVKIIEELDDCF